MHYYCESFGISGSQEYSGCSAAIPDVKSGAGTARPAKRTL